MLIEEIIAQMIPKGLSKGAMKAIEEMGEWNQKIFCYEMRDESRRATQSRDELKRVE